MQTQVPHNLPKGIAQRKSSQLCHFVASFTMDGRLSRYKVQGVSVRVCVCLCVRVCVIVVYM